MTVHTRVLSGVGMAPLRMPRREMRALVPKSAGAMCRKKTLLTPIAEVPSALRAMPFATAAPILALLCAKEIQKRWSTLVKYKVLLLVKMKEKKLLKIQPLLKVLRVR
jgi:hypothetical protein